LPCQTVRLCATLTAVLEEVAATPGRARQWSGRTVVSGAAGLVLTPGCDSNKDGHALGRLRCCSLQGGMSFFFCPMCCAVLDRHANGANCQNTAVLHTHTHTEFVHSFFFVPAPRLS
jgi:hypothetical protein